MGLKNTMIKLKYTPKRFNNRLDEAEKQITCWNTKHWNSHEQQHKEKRYFKK